MFDRFKKLLAKGAETSPNQTDLTPSMEDARSLRADGQVAEARALLETLLQSDPDNRLVLRELVLVCRELGDQSGSTQASRRIFELDLGRDQGLGFQLMDEFEALGDGNGLIKVCERLIEQSPEQAELHFKLGKWLAVKGDEDAAVEAFSRSAELFERLDEWDDAAACYLRLTELEPDKVSWRNDLAFVLSEDEQYDKALEIYRSLIEIDPEDVRFHYNFGRICSQQRKFDQAVESLSRAIAIQPDHLDSLCYLGIACQSTGQYQASIEHFQRAIEVQPDFQYAHFNLAITHVAMGNLVEAHDCLRKCSSILHGEPFNDQAEARLAELAEPPLVVMPPFKLLHDWEQYQYLSETLEEPLFSRMAEDWAALSRSLNLRAIADEDAAVSAEVKIDSGAPPLVRKTINQRVRWRNSPRVEHALNPDLDYPSLQDEFINGPLQAMAIDQILTPDAFAGLRTFCLTNTFWNNLHPGYLGAFCQDGFHSDLLLQIATELRLRLPRIFKHHIWKNFWGFKHDCHHGGIRVHADAAAVNVNFWLAPDDANLLPDKGGLLVWDKRPPADWSFMKLNTDEEAILSLLEQQGSRPVRLAHRENRAVIFSSDLFHRTDDVHFKPGYRNRRLNVTMLYGDRQEVNRWG